MVIAFRKKSSAVVPMHYLTHEGAEPKPWPEWVPAPTDVDLSQRDRSTTPMVLLRLRRGDFTVVAYIYGILFSDGTEWNCVEGWRR